MRLRRRLDGFRGVSRPSIPAGRLEVFEHVYPFAWLGILAQAPPSAAEVIYARHERGFALHSVRSPELTRLYLQCDPAEDLANWPDERIWQELQTRLGTPGSRLTEGPVLQRNIAAMRCFVASRCAMAASTSRAMPTISCRRPAPRA